MLSQNQLKWLNALQIKKYRQKYRKFIVEGDKMVTELLSQQRIQVHSIFALENWLEEHQSHLLKNAEIATTAVNEQELQKISSLTTPNRVLAVAEMPDDELPHELSDYDWCFYLDGIRDPGNLGTIMRIADWFGMPAVFCSPDSADAYSPKTVQSTMGALFRVVTKEVTLPELLQARPDWPVYGAVLGGTSVFEGGFPSAGILVIGSEGKGLDAATETLLTHRVTIPKPEGGGAESLNAAVAAGILAAQIRFGKST
ncbi:MAG: RNA methyltransferase [Saprospiraceae bacterium]|nr:RNA methyltransferase [Saprospiraceae bacterium]